MMTSYYLIEYDDAEATRKDKAHLSKYVLGRLDSWTRKGQRVFAYRGVYESVMKDPVRGSKKLYVASDELDAVRERLEVISHQILLEEAVDPPLISLDAFNDACNERLTRGGEAPFGTAYGESLGDVYRIKATIKIDKGPIGGAFARGHGRLCQAIEESLLGRIRGFNIPPPSTLFTGFDAKPELPEEGVFIFCSCDRPILYLIDVQRVVHGLYHISSHVREILTAFVK